MAGEEGVGRRESWCQCCDAVNGSNHFSIIDRAEPSELITEPLAYGLPGDDALAPLAVTLAL